MANKTMTYVQLPDDSGNSGKKQHTVSKVLSEGTVHDAFMVPARKELVVGVYRAATAQLAVAASAQNGTSTGFLWIMNPTANTTRNIRFRKIWIDSQHSTALATPTAPRLALNLMSWTGSPSGASLAPAKCKSTYAASTIDIRTAVTGLTPTVNALLSTAAICSAITAVGSQHPADIEMIGAASEEDEWIDLAPGEGLVLWQDVAGTASDTRKATVRMIWDEIDIS